MSWGLGKGPLLRIEAGVQVDLFGLEQLTWLGLAGVGWGWCDLSLVGFSFG